MAQRRITGRPSGLASDDINGCAFLVSQTIVFLARVGTYFSASAGGIVPVWNFCPYAAEPIWDCMHCSYVCAGAVMNLALPTYANHQTQTVDFAAKDGQRSKVPRVKKSSKVEL